MARITVADNFTLQCDVDDYLWPWDTSEPVVMLHGFARNASFWRGWIPTLVSKHRVHRPELRGFGRSDVPPEGYVYDTPTLVGDIVKVLDQCGIQSAHFVGESSGGILSTLVALEHPERVTSLTLCDTPTKAATSDRKADYSAGEQSPAAAKLKYGIGEWCRRTLGYRLDLEKASPELQAWYVSEMGKTPGYIGAAFDAYLHPPPHGSLGLARMVKQVVAPVLLLSGTTSKIAGDQQATFARELPNGRLHAFPGYGHGVNVLLPQACAETAMQFWSEL